MLLLPAPRAREVAPTVTVPTEVEALLLRALARKPADRWKDAAELAGQLARVRRAPGAIPRPAASLPVAAPAPETTQAVPVSPGYQEDFTTALSAPALRALLSPKAAAAKRVAPAVAEPSKPAPLTNTPASTTMLASPPVDGPPLLAIAEPTAALIIGPTPVRRTSPPPVSAPPVTPRPTVEPLAELTEALPLSQPVRLAASSLAAQNSDDDQTLAISTSSRGRIPVADATEALRADGRFGVPMSASRPASLPPVQAPLSARPALPPGRVPSAVRQAGPTVSNALPGAVERSPAPASYLSPRILIAFNIALGITIVVIIMTLILRP